MSQQTIPVSKRERAGKGAARAVRRSGLVPGVIYGGGQDPVLVQQDPRPLMKALHTGHFFSSVLSLEVEGDKAERVLPRDVQMHPVTDVPQHVDYMRLTKGSVINVNVPVVFINEEQCPGLREGAVLQVVREDVELICPVDAIPEQVEVDLSNAQFGETIRYSAATHPEGTKPAISDRDFVLATLNAPRVMSEETVDEEAADDQAEDQEES